MPDIVFDPESPPATPPVGADPLVWQLSRHLHGDHVPGPDDFCQACKGFWPCEPRTLAERGLLMSFLPRGPLRQRRGFSASAF